MEAATIGDGPAGKLEELGTVFRYREGQSANRELFKVWTLEYKLAQRPLLQNVLVINLANSETHEAFLSFDSAAKLVKHRV